VVGGKATEFERVKSMTVEELEKVLNGHDEQDLFAALEIFEGLVIDPDEEDDDA
jgi:hypothetical protein